jgi:hypothetical protein
MAPNTVNLGTKWRYVANTNLGPFTPEVWTISIQCTKVGWCLNCCESRVKENNPRLI